MRTLYRTSTALGAAVLALAWTGGASADNYLVNQHQTGVTLPGVSMPSGYDEVRAADGTTCRSSMGGSGAYLDSGIIGGGLSGASSNSMSAYGRIVVPLGERPRRLNCDQLYRLELERLQFEVQMLQRGLDPRLTDSTSDDDDWAKEGWSTDGKQADTTPEKLVPEPPAPVAAASNGKPKQGSSVSRGKKANGSPPIIGGLLNAGSNFIEHLRR